MTWLIYHEPFWDVNGGNDSSWNFFSLLLIIIIMFYYWYQPEGELLDCYYHGNGKWITHSMSSMESEFSDCDEQMEREREREHRVEREKYWLSTSWNQELEISLSREKQVLKNSEHEKETFER